MNVKDLVKDKTVVFDAYRQGLFYYNITDPFDSKKEVYQFTVPIDDIGTSTLLAKDKALLFMRWIRLAVENNTLAKIK